MGIQQHLGIQQLWLPICFALAGWWLIWPGNLK
jgi:hypothetical protein